MHKQNRQHQFFQAKTQLGAINRRHGNDRADGVVVDQEGNQVLEQLAVFLDIAEGLAQAPEADAQDGLGRAPASPRPTVAPEPGADRQGKDQPPDGDAQEGQTNAGILEDAVGNEKEHGDIDRQQDAAALITQA